MHKSRKLVVLALGTALLYAAYWIYDVTLGSYDGLLPLPEEYRPGNAQTGPSGPLRLPNSAVQKLLEAFGPTCEEKDRRIKLEWRLQGIVVAADRWKLLDNGHVQLTKVSVALFGKPRTDGKPSEINTLRGQVAEIEFDRPLQDLKDLSSRKPVAGRLEGEVRLQNNRGTPQPEDDLFLFTDWLAYRDDQHRIWTEAPVRLLDGDPPQYAATANGLEVLLIPGAPSAKSEKKPLVAGVRQVRLERDVWMHMLLDDRSGFLSSANKGRLQPQKNLLKVTSRGPFTYEVEAERASFCDGVNVLRTSQPVPPSTGTPQNTELAADQLDCDKLVMQFRRAPRKEGPLSGDERTFGLELLYAKATGKEVTLVSESEHLHAVGTEFVYDHAAGRTTLSGNPELLAEHRGHRLRLQGPLILDSSPPSAGGATPTIRGVLAEGPGQATLMGADQRPILVARWSKRLQSLPDGTYDLLILTGTATLEDPVRGHLQAQQIRIWLDRQRPPESGAPRSGTADATGSLTGQILPRRVEAVDQVALVSRAVVVPQTDRLVVQIEDVPPGSLPQSGARLLSWQDMQASSAAARQPSSPTQSGEPTASSVPPAPTASGADSPVPRPKSVPSAKTPEPRKEPITLRGARSVEVWLAYDGQQSALRRLIAEGRLHITQPGNKEGDEGIELAGERLELQQIEDVCALQVAGQSALLRLDRLELIGPLIRLDQVKNEVHVSGTGSMRLPGRTDFQGRRLQEPQDIIIHWKEWMVFDGRVAEFHGAVEARQGASGLVCQRTLQVLLDRRISLRQRPPGSSNEAAGLEKLLGDGSVRLTYRQRQGDSWQLFRQIEGEALAFYNTPADLPSQSSAPSDSSAVPAKAGEIRVSGPGRVTLFQPGSRPDPTLGPGQTAGEKEMKLTVILFDGLLTAQQPSGLAVFRDHVQVIHLPASEPETDLTPERLTNLPEGSFLLECEQLKVLGKNDGEHTLYLFEGQERVRLQAREFAAEADRISYDQAKEQIVLTAQGNNAALVYRQSRPGGQRDILRGRKIIYFRKDNRFQIAGAETLDANP